jgi:UDP-GlcNAc:undecaprenyl-phosphate GlcNAc-1-phosphate transferase
MVAIVLALAATAIASWLLRRPVSEAVLQSGLVRSNFRGATVAPSGGIVIVLSSVVGYGLIAAMLRRGSVDYGLVLGLVLSAFVGLLDDAAGRGSRKGFSGHFGGSVNELTVSTGVLKAVFVSLAAVLVALGSSPSAYETFLRAGGIALTANLLNLLDLRPGRCIKVYLVLSALATAIAGVDLSRFGPVMAATLVVLPADLREDAMLGDCGSNLLGFAVGAHIARVSPTWFLPLWVTLGLALNLASERYSFTSIIESNRVLRWLDSLGRREESE